MRVWLLKGKPGEGPGDLEPVLRQWLSRPEYGHWSLEVRPLGSDLASEVQAQQPEVVVLAETSCPHGPWVDEVLGQGAALVVATAGACLEVYRNLAEQFPVHLVPLPPAPEALGLALLGAQASRRRLLFWKAQAEQLQQRLNDRIIIERAKGILVQRLRITEEEAYKRLRVLSRRQRRQIRDIAQSLLDTQSLLTPEDNGFVDPSARPPEGPGPSG